MSLRRTLRRSGLRNEGYCRGPIDLPNVAAAFGGGKDTSGLALLSRRSPPLSYLSGSMNLVPLPGLTCSVHAVLFQYR